MPLNAKQKEAVEYIEGPLLVLAGPGTGKTQLLTSKVAHILNVTDASPENILCLTYTDAGVKAMRERLQTMRVANAERVNISTYHSFGQKIIGEYKNYAENFTRNLDHSVDSIRQVKFIQKAVKSLPATDILLTGGTFENVCKDTLATIGEAKTARLTYEDLDKIADENLRMAEVLNPLLNDCLQNYVRNMKYRPLVEQVYEPMRQVFIENMPSDFIVGDVKPEIYYIWKKLEKILAEGNAQLEAYEAFVARGGKRNDPDAVKAPSVSNLNGKNFKDKYFELDENGNYRLANRIANKKLKSVAKVYQRYSEMLDENGEFDYADMIIEAIKALQSDAGFKATLQERYQYILLDEFQDTNKSQLEIVELLTDYEMPSVMAVGDDDQAIYAFQGATVSNLKDFAAHYNAKVITLTENYRSTQEVLDLGRKVADKIDESFARDQEISKDLVSMRNAELAQQFPTLPMVADDYGTRIVRHEFLEATSEYTWVAEQIHQLVEKGVRQSEIAVICPYHKYLMAIVPYLKNHNDINIAYEKRENVLDVEKVRELTTLARFIYDLAENKKASGWLIEILSFDFWDVSPYVVMNQIQSKYKDDRGAFDYLLGEENNATPELKAAAEKIAELVQKSFTTPLEEFVAELAKLVAKNMDETDAYEFYECLEVLVSRLVDYCHNITKPRLGDFIEFLNDYEAAHEMILNTSPYRDSENSVQLMTAYGSKGLEFDHVFLISVDDAAWGKSEGNNNKLTLPRNLEYIRHTGITDDEKLRLLFVAMTRARVSLTMTNSRCDFAGKDRNRLAYLDEYALDSGDVVSSLLPNTNVVEHIGEDSIPSLKDLKTSFLARYFVPKGDMREQMKARLDNYRLSASDLTKFVDLCYGGPLAFYRDKVMRVPRDADNAKTSLGNLVHATFEQVTNAKISDDEAKAYFEELLGKLDMDEDDVRILRERGEVALDKSLVEFSDILRADADSKIKAIAELDFYNDHLEFNGIPITGKIDHVNIDEENKTIEIYDFKTGSFKKDKWGANDVLYKYGLQLSFYKLLLNCSNTYRNYKVTRGHILFVCPDKNGDVFDKVYNFELDDVMKDLIPRVYAEMRALDFLDEDNPLHVESDQALELKDIKEFISKIIGKEVE
ncbi:MAG: ATP-dependent DNA helicase [Candidatus Saccharibacteria bacterium]|nr:ATP-dependent DNA helicase [Candidatus Saccharibacteria bacterium]